MPSWIRTSIRRCASAAGCSSTTRLRQLPEIYRWLDQALVLPDAEVHRLMGRAELFHHVYGDLVAARVQAGTRKWRYAAILPIVATTSIPSGRWR